MKRAFSSVFVPVVLFMFVFAGCGGDNGSAGASGAGGPQGPAGNNWPIANAGPDQKAAAAGIMVALDGSDSSDPDGDMLTYAWSITARPVGSLATLSSSTISSPTFTPDKAGKYELSLVVNDEAADSPPDTVTVRAGMPLPDTGQTRWYSTVFGDDGDYTINPPSYTDNGDGTILDNVTGLTWQKCSMGQSGLDCATGAAVAYAWAAAADACKSLNLPGTGWRLPSRRELLTIVDYGLVSEPYSSAIYDAYFPKTGPWPYWSSTTSAFSMAEAWFAGFGSGVVHHSPKTDMNPVRCVR